VNPGVTGKVTLKLNEVPWGRALELILKTNGLGCVLEDNVIRIARLSDLQREEADRRKLDEEKSPAGEFTDYTRRTLRQGRNARPSSSRWGLARGQINIDERTNTIIIRDPPTFVRRRRARWPSSTRRRHGDRGAHRRDEPELARLRHPVGLAWKTNRYGNTTGHGSRTRSSSTAAACPARVFPPTTWAPAASRQRPGSGRPAAGTP
jgi:hypothetical protein